MILFKSDWDKYPNAIVDLKTTNESALKLSKLFKEMGAENHLFILALHDPELQGVDPHDPNISQENMIRVAQECRINPWYAVREVIRLPASSGADPLRYRLNRFNIAQMWLFFNHITTLGIAPRQTGKSVASDVLSTILMSFMTVNTKMTLLTKDDALRVANVTRLKDIYSELPPYLQLKNRTDTNNTEKITINALNNTYTTNVAQPSIKGALKLGRGITVQIVDIDEISFIKNISITLPALLASTGAARDNAKSVGEPYGNFFTTTAGYLNSEEGAYVHKEIYQKAMPWTEKLYDCENEESLIDVIMKNSPGKKLMVLLEFNHRQLGYTDEWMRGKIADAMAEGDAVLADFLNIWPEGNSSSPISKNLLKIISDSIVQEPYIEISEQGYITRWYVTPQDLINKVPEMHTIISLDTSDAVGRDDIAMTLRNIKTGGTIAAGQYNETNLITFSEWLIEWLTKYYKLTMIIERRSSGVAIIDNLLKILPAKGIDPFKRLFNWVVDEIDEYPARADEVFNKSLAYRDPNVYIKYRKHFGYATSGSGKASREGLYGNTLLASLKYTGAKARDKALVDQIAGLTVRNGRIDHKSGFKDDLVISWVLGYWFLTNARHKKYYNIEDSIVLSSVINNELVANGTKDRIEKQNYQLALKEEIDRLLEQIHNEKNNIKIMMLTNRIKHLYQEIDTSYIQIVNIDNLLENINMEKKKMNYNRYR